MHFNTIQQELNKKMEQIKEKESDSDEHGNENGN